MTPVGTVDAGTIADMTLASMPMTHLRALTGTHGVFEHARGDQPRVEHGYCTDDVARVLTVAARAQLPGAGGMAGQDADALRQWIESSLVFLERAVVSDGSVHNRMSASGEWTDAATIGDWWGRALLGLGVTVSHTQDAGIRSRALRVFLRAAARSSVDVRACAFAALGAVEVLTVLPETTTARMLLFECLARIPRVGDDGLWPEPRLRYANAALCSALIVGGDVLHHAPTRSAGLRMLEVLLALETSPAGHLSVVGAHGRAREDTSPSGDQQPIEVAALAEACAHALVATGDRRWAHETLRAWAWFTGANDAGIAMFDPATGAGYDGLEPAGRNDNRGAESTLAAISTHQSARIALRWLT